MFGSHVVEKCYHALVGLPLCLVLLLATTFATAQDRSTARLWTTELLEAIRLDGLRTPVHARDMFHVQAALYDAWAAYDSIAEPYLLGNVMGTVDASFQGVLQQDLGDTSRAITMSYAAFRLLEHRLLGYASLQVVYPRLVAVMDSLGCDLLLTGQDPMLDGPAGLGNFIANAYIELGLSDGANESNGYVNASYVPLNNSLDPLQPGNPSMQYQDRWQPLAITVFDELGESATSVQDFIAAQWGEVIPFALEMSDIEILDRDGQDWMVHLNSGAPPSLSLGLPTELDSPYKWGFCMNSIWQSHLSTEDGVLWDTSPGARGNVPSYPADQAALEAFYDLFNGGDVSSGHSLNPVTGEAYVPQLVLRGDHARVVAEHWSVLTPDGGAFRRWFQMLFDAMEHPLFERRWMGEGPIIEEEAYDVRAFFTLSAALHDAAVAAWSNKAYYDHVRPISAIRFMADLGQSSDQSNFTYQPGGIPLIPGFIEEIQAGDPLAGTNGQHINKVKVYTYAGAGQVADPATDVAGVDWILAQNWTPYQQSDRVSPPSAGHVNGTTALSSAAADVIAAFTGSAYFPGGLYSVLAPADAYLQIEQGPSASIELQWATYADAADACGLAQIWGGISSPYSEMAGRRMGLEVGPMAVARANALFNADRPKVIEVQATPQFANRQQIGEVITVEVRYDRPMDNAQVPVLTFLPDDPFQAALQLVSVGWVAPDRLSLEATVLDVEMEFRNLFLSIDSAIAEGVQQAPSVWSGPFLLDTKAPVLLTFGSSVAVVNSTLQGAAAFTVQLDFSESCDTSSVPMVEFSAAVDLSSVLSMDPDLSSWQGDTTFVAVFSLSVGELEVASVDALLSNVFDKAGNPLVTTLLPDLFLLDTRAPLVVGIGSSGNLITLQQLGNEAWSLDVEFDESMNEGVAPILGFINGDPLQVSLVPNPLLSTWSSDTTFRFVFALVNNSIEWPELGIRITGHQDGSGNEGAPYEAENVLTIDTRRPSIAGLVPSTQLLADADVGQDGLRLLVQFSEVMDMNAPPLVQAVATIGLDASLQFWIVSSTWLTASEFEAVFAFSDDNVEAEEVGFLVSFASDINGNSMSAEEVPNVIAIDSRNPLVASLTALPELVTDIHLGPGGARLQVIFDEAMRPDVAPLFNLEPSSQLAGAMVYEEAFSDWVDLDIFDASFGVYALPISVDPITVGLQGARDLAGNPMDPVDLEPVFSIQLSGVGIREFTAARGYLVYPNPVASAAVIHLLGERFKGVQEFSLCDILGREVHAGSLRHDWLLLPPLTAGPYLVIFRSDVDQFSVPLIIE